MQRQVVLQVNAVCLHVQRGVFDAQVPNKITNTRVFKALKERAHSRAGAGARFQGNILCHYAMHGHPLQTDSYRLLDFTVAVGASTHL